MDDVARAVAQEIEKWLPWLITSGVAVVVWAIRVEGKMRANEQIADLIKVGINQRIDKVETDHKSLETKHSQLQDKIVDKLSVIEKHLSKIEGRLSITDGDIT